MSEFLVICYTFFHECEIAFVKCEFFYILLPLFTNAFHTREWLYLPHTL